MLLINKKQTLILFLLLLIFPLYLLSGNVVFNNKYYSFYIFIISIISFLIILKINKTLRLMVTEKYILKKKNIKLLRKDKVLLKLNFYALKLAFLTGLLLVNFYIYYSALNSTIYLFSLNSNLYYETVEIYKLEMYRNNMKYQFFFKNDLLSKRTEMNNFNRDVLDGKINLKDYMILIKYRKSIFNTYYINDKILKTR